VKKIKTLGVDIARKFCLQLAPRLEGEIGPNAIGENSRIFYFYLLGRSAL